MRLIHISRWISRPLPILPLSPFNHFGLIFQYFYPSPLSRNRTSCPIFNSTVSFRPLSLTPQFRWLGCISCSRGRGWNLPITERSCVTPRLLGIAPEPCYVHELQSDTHRETLTETCFSSSFSFFLCVWLLCCGVAAGRPEGTGPEKPVSSVKFHWREWVSECNTCSCSPYIM